MQIAPNTAPLRTPLCGSLRRAPDPRQPRHQAAGAGCAGVMMVVAKRAAFSGRLRGLELVPAKRRCLVPPTRG